MPASLSQSALGQSAGGGSSSSVFACDSGYQVNDITMSYGAFSFTPVPFMTINKNYNRTQDQEMLSSTFNLNLQGQIALINNPGIDNVVEAQREIREAFSQDGRYFVVRCGDDVILECYPKVLNVTFDTSNDNWVYTTPYTISLEYENEPVGNIAGYGSGENITENMPPFIRDFQETWQVEFLEENSKYSVNTTAGIDENPYALRLTHNVSAVGVRHYGGSGQLIGTLDKPAWKQAREYVTNRLGYQEEMLVADKTLNLSGAMWSAYDHGRTNIVGTANGSYTVNETWLVLSNNIDNPRAAVEDFTVEVNDNLQDDFDTVTIQGTIRGLESRSYGSNSGDFNLTQTRYNAASGYWASIKSNLLYGRVANVAAQENLTLNATPQTKLIGHSFPKGIITYSYGYDTRPTNCVPNARYENITITDNNPVDVFGEIRILGRGQGPILQDMNTVTKFSRTLNIEVLVSGNNGCGYLNLISGNNPDAYVVSNIICPVYSGLTAMYDTVLKEQDSVSWLPKTGRYNRSITWAATDCSTSPNTAGFC